MTFLQALRGDLAGGRAGGVGQRRRVGLQRLRKDARIKQALGKEQQGKAGIDGCGLDGDRQGECIGVGLVGGERRQTGCIARP
ncbi:hypothetical protein X770_14875 [Mesorhizobium sp. LSJC269B00]|nr:hypothetical protein X770_14875 [Mesorhizobium sp. LSJC269B00]